MSLFDDLIQNLSSVMGISLQAELERFCKIKFASGLSVQIEYLPSKDSILLSSYLCEIPSGAFRVDILIKALKANHNPDALGSFAYLDKNNCLVLELYLPTSTSPELLADKLKQFTEKGLQWKEAVELGRLSLIDRVTSVSLPQPFSN